MEPNYDAAARRERYLRERQLKGREPGKGDEPKSGSAPPKAPPPPADRSAARAAAAARVKSLNLKLTNLRAALQAARKKSSPSDKPSAGEAKSKDKAYNEDYYNKNKTKIANDRKADARKSGGGSKSETPAKPAARGVEELESAIRSTLVELKAAITKLRSL